MRDTIATRLSAALPDAMVEVIDESDAHVGHAGHDGRGESHFRVVLRGTVPGDGRLARHRAVHAALGPEVIGRIHALAIEIDPARR
ncbi:MAG: BolA family protein [Paracoccaceae bacterium]